MELLAGKISFRHYSFIRILMRKFVFILLILSVALSAGCKAADTPQPAPSVYGYSVTEFYADCDGNSIYCKLYTPQKEGALPAVILSHSAKLTAESMNSYAEGFATRGFLACSFDFCGGSPDSRSDGSEEDMTVFTETDNLKTVIASVRDMEKTDKDCILLFGASQGGFVSALTANQSSEYIDGLILLYPAFNIPELAQKYSSGSGKYTESLNGFNAYENIGNFKGKVLILHGSKDIIVDKSYSERAAEVYENCELQIIDGATHGFNGDNLTFSGVDLSTFFGNYDDVVWQHIDDYLSDYPTD